MSVQLTGLEYLGSYSGILKVAEEILNTLTILSASYYSYGHHKSYFLLGVATFALIFTGILLILHLIGFTKKSDLPWFWIECVSCLVLAITYILSASIVLSELTKGFIITGVIGYIATGAYILDTMDQYKLATTQRARYVWTTPNLPE